MSSAGKWTELEIVMLSKIGQTRTTIAYFLSYVEWSREGTKKVMKIESEVLGGKKKSRRKRGDTG